MDFSSYTSYYCRSSLDFAHAIVTKCIALSLPENVYSLDIALCTQSIVFPQTLGTAACPPYHLAIVIGGTSAEFTMKTVKLASTKYLDGLPTSGTAYIPLFIEV